MDGQGMDGREQERPRRDGEKDGRPVGEGPDDLAGHEFDVRLGDALREAHPVAPFPADGIETRIRRSVARRGPVKARKGSARWWKGHTARAVLAAAASLVLFIGGMEYGRRMAPATVDPGAVPDASAAAGQPVSLPLSIQSAGTRYVATLARFSGETAGLSPEQRRVAREVALAALSAAAVELLREAGEDETLRAVAEMIAARRSAIGEGEPRRAGDEG